MDNKTSQDKIVETCDAVKEMLLQKNRKYGDSALKPIRIFSQADSIEQIKVRIDDKINRLMNQQNDEDEDVVFDLAGYLILLLIAMKDARQSIGIIRVEMPDDELEKLKATMPKIFDLKTQLIPTRK